MVDLDRQIKEAMGAHGSWKLRLKEGIARGSLADRAEHISRDDLCTFGKWLLKLADDPDVGSSTEYKSVVVAHRRFHQAAGQIAKCVETNRADAAAELLNGADFQILSDRLCKAMIDWRQSLQ